MKFLVLDCNKLIVENKKQAMNIRIAKEQDLPRIMEIYNQAIPSMRSTADTELFKVEERWEWFHEHTPGKYSIYVAEHNGIVIGWNSLSPYRTGRQAFRYVRETSYYIDQGFQGRGIASRLLDFVIETCPELNIKTLLAFILEHNKASIKLITKFGFERWGYLPLVADFKGEEFNHTIYGKKV